MKRHENTTTYNNPVPVEALPESPELERAVLGALILEPDKLPDIADIIGISSFSDTINGKIYGEMLSMSEHGDKIDLYTLSERCKNIPELERPAVYLAGLTQMVGSGANVLEHARKLKDTETRRRLCLFACELKARCISDPAGVFDWAMTEIATISASTIPTDSAKPLSEIVRQTLESLECRQLSGGIIGIPTGLQRLDVLTGGWRGGQLIVLAGRPAMGKSAVMLHFARVAAASGVPVCIFSLEMPSEQLAGRLLIGGSNVSFGAFRTGKVDTGEWHKLEQAGAELSTLPVYLNDRANLSINAIRSQCRVMQRHKCCGMVIIDYLQLLDTSTANRNDTREREIAAASRAAKLLAKELDVPVILLSQLSRKVEERADKTPLLSDLRESGAIEQDADMVVFIDRPAVYGMRTIETIRYGTIPSDGVGVLHIAKNREGATGRIYFRHNESLTVISDYETTAPDTIGTSVPF